MWAQQEQCSPARRVSGAGSLKSHGNQGRGIYWRGVGQVFLQGRVKGVCQVPLTRQGGDALTIVQD